MAEVVRASQGGVVGGGRGEKGEWCSLASPGGSGSKEILSVMLKSNTYTSSHGEPSIQG